MEGEKFKCETGDAFFVRAEARHYFEKFTEDFATRVFSFKR